MEVLVSTSWVEEMLRDLNLRALVVCESTGLTPRYLAPRRRAQALRVLDLWGNLKISGWYKVPAGHTRSRIAAQVVRGPAHHFRFNVVKRMANIFRA